MNYSDKIEERLKVKKENISKKDYTIPKPENKPIKAENKSYITQNVTNPTPIKKRGDYKNWEENWKISDNPILEELDELGFVIYMNEKGDLTYSVDGGKEETVTKDKASHFLSNKLGRRIYLFSDKENSIKPYDIIGIVGRTFEPSIHKRFIELKKRKFLKNEFTPTSYMKYTDKPNKEPKVIFSYIYNLVGYDDEKFKYFINWLAYFFQTLKRPQVAIVLKGEKGTGKDRFFDLIITPLFGINQTIKLNDKTIESNYNADTFENKLFIAFNEIKRR